MDYMDYSVISLHVSVEDKSYTTRDGYNTLQLRWRPFRENCMTANRNEDAVAMSLSASRKAFHHVAPQNNECSPILTNNRRAVCPHNKRVSFGALPILHANLAQQ
jgi:hypothetical protein